MSSRSAALLALASSAMIGGCYASHERAADAGPRIDVGSCTAPRLPGAVAGLSCPTRARAGEAVVVTVAHTIDACCRDIDEAVLPIEVRPGRDTPDFGLLPFWSACECCATCGCPGTTTMQSVSLGPFEAGIVGVGAGAARCSIVID